MFMVSPHVVSLPFALCPLRAAILFNPKEPWVKHLGSDSRAVYFMVCSVVIPVYTKFPALIKSTTIQFEKTSDGF